MLWRLRQFTAIARISLLEIIRQPVFLLLSAFAILFISLLPVLITHTLGESARIVRDNGLAVHFAFGLLLGSYAASTALAGHTALGTAALVLSKPVGRSLFFLAKFAGAALATLLFSLGAGLATLLSVRMATGFFTLDWWVGGPLLAAPLLAFALGGALNYRDRGPFVSRTFVGMLTLLVATLVWAGFVDPEGHRCAFGMHLEWRIVPASLLICLALLILTGVASLLATRLETVTTLILCSVLLFLGLMSDYLFGRHADQSVIAAVLYNLTPNWQHFWLADALAGDGAIPWNYVGRAALYGLLYLGGTLGLGLAAFRRSELRSG
jgi:ABC-type transport system involved in multi-copper enzyme maturation permease subunit